MTAPPGSGTSTPSAPPATRPATVVITGAAGLVGSALALDLAVHGWRVRALARDMNAASAHALARASVAIEVLPTVLPDAIDPRAFAGLTPRDVVVHAAYATRGGRESVQRATNEDGTRCVLGLARASGARFIFVSSIAADTRARAYYARSKGELEALLDPGRDLILRPGLVLSTRGGLFTRLLDQVRRGRRIPLIAGGAQPVQTIHVDDLARGVRQALDRGLTGVLRLAEEEPITMRDFLAQIARRVGLTPRFVRVPAVPLLAVLALSERLGVPAPISRDNVRGLLAMRAVDVRADLARVGLAPRTARESLHDLLGRLDAA